MSALGQKRTLRRVRVMSALPPKADIGTQSCDVCFVPKADIEREEIDREISMTALGDQEIMLWRLAQIGDVTQNFSWMVGVVQNHRDQRRARLHTIGLQRGCVCSDPLNVSDPTLLLATDRSSA